MIRRMPPAESAPAVPRKIVASLPSIFSQMRRAVAEVAALKRDPLHALEHVVGRQSGVDDERLDRLAKETRLATAHARSFYVTIALHVVDVRARDVRRKSKSAIGESVMPSQIRLRDGDVGLAPTG